jgi:hypothetical protein
LNGAVHIVDAIERAPQIAIGAREIRLLIDGFAEFGDRFVELIQIKERDAKIVTRFCEFAAALGNRRAIGPDSFT